MPTRTLLAEGVRDCPECGETKDRLSRHWSFCEFPDVEGSLRALLTGVLLGGGSLQGRGANTRHLMLQTTSRDLAEWLFGELDWLAHSLRREAYDDQESTRYYVRTHGHSYLRRLRDDWYPDGGDKRLRPDASVTATPARVWWALAGGLEWVGDYDSQVRGTFSAEADQRGDAIASVLEAAGYEPERLDRRVCLFGDDLREWLEWLGYPVPGAIHKWALERDLYQRVKNDETRPGGTKITVRERDLALRAAVGEVGEPLRIDAYDEWRGQYSWPPAWSSMAGRWTWSGACKAAGIWSEVREHETVDVLLDAVRRIREEIGHWPDTEAYREHRHPDEPARTWFYRNDPGGLDGWDDVVAAAAGVDSVGELAGYGPMVEACPDCDSSQILERVRKRPAYRCDDCDAEFAEPVTRQSYRASGD